jgi:hypothetical protein
MKSALECFNHAARCEEMARASCHDDDRRMLLATAKIWRGLGESSEKPGPISTHGASPRRGG